MRSAGRPTSSPIADAASRASAAAVQKPKPSWVVRIAVTYAPTPKNATWAMLIWPAMPMTSPRPIASRANRSATSTTWMA